MSRNTIEIPLKESADEVIELDLDELPDCREVLQILQSESAPLNVWIQLGIVFDFNHTIIIFFLLTINLFIESVGVL